MHFRIHPLRKLIAQGEGPTLDFKKTISSAKKIAKTLSAFSNTGGGRLLIGVKDNGKIVGCSGQEELYMIESAAHNFSRPLITFEYTEHQYEDKIVLEIYVPKSPNLPHYAKDEEGKWWAYRRVEDRTLLATKVMLDVMQRDAKHQNTIIRYSAQEQQLMSYLDEHGHITLRQLMKLLKVSRFKAMRILVNLISVGVLNVSTTQNAEFYSLNPLYDAERAQP
jgi:predicted HTH transcriptional regulator